MATAAQTSNQVSTVLPVNVLRDALTATLLAAAAATYLPVLNAVQIVKQGPTLVFRSTDRYRLVRVTVTLGSPPEGDWVTLLSAADVKQVVAALPKKGFSVATVGPVDDRFEVTVLDGASLRFTPVDGDYPKTDQIIPTSFEPTESIAFKPSQLADAAKMPGRGKNEPVVFRFNGKTKPALSEWTEEPSAYLYLLMPFRMDE